MKKISFFNYKYFDYLLFLFAITIGLSTYYYFPGYLRDDWGIIGGYLYGDYNILSKFKQLATSLFANRPGLAFINSFVSYFIGDNPKIFFVFNYVLYGFGILFFKKFLEKILNFQLNFLLPILIFPIISSTSIFSPVNLLGANFSFLFYSIGSFILFTNIKKITISKIFLATILFSISLLTYEISGPLILYNIFLIFFFLKKEFLINKKKVIRLLIPIVLSLFIYFIYQKFICGYLDGNNCAVSRFKLTSIILKPEMILKSFISYIIIVFVNFPIFILSSFYYIFSKFDFISTIQLLITAFLLYKLKYNLKFPDYKFDNKFNIFFYFSIIISSLIFVLSGTEYPTIYGYENRGVYPCTIIIGVLIFFTFTNFKYLRKFYTFFLFLIILNFIIQAQEIRENYREQSNIINEVKKIEKDKQNHQFILILPMFNTEYNFSNHEIFRYDWDLPNAIKLRSDQKINNRYYLINNSNLKNIKILKDKIILDGYINIKYSNLNLLKYKVNEKKLINIADISSPSKFRNIKDNLLINFNNVTNNSIEIEPKKLRRRVKTLLLKVLNS